MKLAWWRKLRRVACSLKELEEDSDDAQGRTQHVGRTKAITWVGSTRNWVKSGGYLLGKSDGESGGRGSPPARNTKPPGRGLGWRSSRSVRSTFAQQRSTASTVSATSTPCWEPVLQRVVTSSDCRTKRDGTSKISASGYRVIFSGECIRNGQHGVGLAIQEDVVKKAGEDGIVIECISARLLKGLISIKSNFVTFVVAYAPTEEAPEGQKTKYMEALNCTVASVPAREYVFV